MCDLIPKPGQAGTSDGGDCFQSGGLRFKTKHDSFGYADELVKRGHQWAVSNGLSTRAEDYIKGKNCIRIECDRGDARESSYLHFIVEVAPFAENEPHRAGHLEDSPLQVNPGVLWSHRYDSLVRVSSEASQCPEQWVPSIVRLEAESEGYNSTVNVSAFFPPRMTEVSDALPEREVDVLGILAAKLDSGITHGLVECEPRLLQDGRSNSADTGWHASLQAQCDDSFARLVVYATDKFVRAVVTEGDAIGLKLNKVFFSALD